jgi:agmatine deiminase
MKNLTTTPRSDGFRMPAEFEPHRGTLITYPYRTDVWRQNGIPAQDNYMEVAAAIAKHEPVFIVTPPSMLLEAQARYDIPNVTFIPLESDDAWVRDNGPTFLIDPSGHLRAVDWVFNAWGGDYDGLYKPWDTDDAMAEALLKIFNVDRYRTEGFVLEGGSIHVDGQGLAMVTASCLLSPGRNPHLNQDQITEMLKKYLNVKKVIWLPFGVYNDNTNGHVDNIACFVAPGHVLIAVHHDKNDPQYAMSQASLEVLRNTKGVDGKPLKITEMVFPSEIVYSTDDDSLTVDPNPNAKPRPSGKRLVASYINFYICNGAIVMPAFRFPSDQVAAAILQDLFPDREIIPIYSKEILLGGGNIHCITQQIPKGTTNDER